jgi:hypothetical protein
MMRQALTAAPDLPATNRFVSNWMFSKVYHPLMISTADNLQAIDLAVEAEDRGVDVAELALVNGVHSEKVIVLARQLREVLDELHRELHRIGAARGFSPQEVDQVFHERLAAMMPKPKRAQ